MKCYLYILFISLSLVACYKKNPADETNRIDKEKGSGTDADTGTSSREKNSITVSDEGGTFDFGEMKLKVPEGALTKTVEISIEEIEPPVPIPDEYRRSSSVYRCTPHGLEFEKPVSLEFRYKQEANRIFSVLRLSDDEDDSWETVEASRFEIGVASLQIEHFSLYVVVGKTQESLSGRDAGTKDIGVVATGLDASPNSDFSDADIEPDDSTISAGGGGTSAEEEAGSSGSGETDSSIKSTCLLPGNGDYGEPGPYSISKQDSVDITPLTPIDATERFTIFYPWPLNADCLHPIVSWGNNEQVYGSAIYEFFNYNAASWGIVVIASDVPADEKGSNHKAGIDYLLEQNQDPRSIFYQKLSTRAGTAGHAQGAVGATVASEHPNVEAEVGVAGSGEVGINVAFLCLTGTEDTAEAQCTETYKSAPGPAFLADWEGGDQLTTETLPGYLAKDPGTLQMQRLYTAWFRCFLADDQVACDMFRGSPCGICGDDGWAKIEGRNIE